MKTRSYLLLTAISGMIGMLALISTNIFKSRIAQADLTQPTDEAIDQLHFFATSALASLLISQIAVAGFVIFLILYLISKNRTTSPK